MGTAAKKSSNVLFKAISQFPVLQKVVYDVCLKYKPALFLRSKGLIIAW